MTLCVNKCQRTVRRCFSQKLPFKCERFLISLFWPQLFPLIPGFVNDATMATAVPKAETVGNPTVKLATKLSTTTTKLEAPDVKSESKATVATSERLVKEESPDETIFRLVEKGDFK